MSQLFDKSMQTLELNRVLELLSACAVTEEGKQRVNIGDGTEGGTDVGYLIEFGGEINPEGKKTFFLNNVPDYSGDGGWVSGKLAKIKSPDPMFPPV